MNPEGTKIKRPSLIKKSGNEYRAAGCIFYNEFKDFLKTNPYSLIGYYSKRIDSLIDDDRENDPTIGKLANEPKQLNQIEKMYIKAVMDGDVGQKHERKHTPIAKLLGIKPDTLKKKLLKYNISFKAK